MSEVSSTPEPTDNDLDGLRKDLLGLEIAPTDTKLTEVRAGFLEDPDKLRALYQLVQLHEEAVARAAQAGEARGP